MIITVVTATMLLKECDCPLEYKGVKRERKLGQEAVEVKGEDELYKRGKRGSGIKKERKNK